MLRLLSLLTFSLLLAACGPSGTEVESSDAVAENTTTEAAAVYTVDAQASTVSWEGTKLIGGGHTGTVPLTAGNLKIDGEALVGGEFTLNLAGLENSDLDGDGKGKLEGHLKSADFFDVEQYPTAKFTITGVSPTTDADDHNYTVTGNLTMKGNARSITIPANITLGDEQITATTPEFVIDRTEWGIEYNSGSTEGILKDKVINDEIGLKLDLVAKR
ncbi:YceI family protein [Lewinella sp. JB7]|uniref:YceI family protein n=1 Tax=Lewinella sp. JB7 TaxID=2962887 RepID=UPI0020CA16A2|nr:YceI family protein [Lewinella sp. JB7]MCP9234619.1 YceI family protein [Lewinella sp. JB7]